MKLFRSAKTIRSKDKTLVFNRWAIIETQWFSLYIHKINKADADPYLHNHPWRLFTLILRGGYTEQVSNGLGSPVAERKKSFLSFHYYPFHVFHKIKQLNNDKPSISLAFTIGKRRPWGYDIAGKLVTNEDYRASKDR